MVNKKLTNKQLKKYIKKGEVVLIKTTKNFKNIPKGTVLFVGHGFGEGISTHNFNTDSKNGQFGYNFDYEWEYSWDDYIGEFELIDETQFEKEKIKEKIKELEKLGYEVKKKKIKYPIEIKIGKSGYVKIEYDGKISVDEIYSDELEDFRDKIIPKAIEIRDSKD